MVSGDLAVLRFNEQKKKNEIYYFRSLVPEKFPLPPFFFITFFFYLKKICTVKRYFYLQKLMLRILRSRYISLSHEQQMINGLGEHSSVSTLTPRKIIKEAKDSAQLCELFNSHLVREFDMNQVFFFLFSFFFFVMFF